MSTKSKSKKKGKNGNRNRHTPNAKDALFLKAMERAPDLKKWMQREGIWIKELFQFLVLDLKVTQASDIGKKIANNEEYDDVVRLVKLKRLESNKDQEELKRLDKNLLKFEKLWRSQSGVTRSKTQKSSKSKPKPKPKPKPKKEPKTESKPKPKPKAKPKKEVKKEVKFKKEVKPKPKPKPKPESKPQPKLKPKLKNVPKAQSSAVLVTRPPPQKVVPAKRPKNIKRGVSSALIQNRAREGRCGELEKAATELAAQAEKYEKKKAFRKAIKYYTGTIFKLFKTVPLIKEKKEKKERVTQIDGFKVKKQKCQYSLVKDKRYRREHEKKGMELCSVAQDYENKHAYDQATKYYEKGIPFLERSIENLDHKLSRQYKANKIARYKANLERCKEYKANNNHINDDATLFDYIGVGNVDKSVVYCCDLRDLYLALPTLISAISRVPISFKKCFRDELLEKLNDVIETSPQLEQRLRCYLFSYSFDKKLYFNTSLKSMYRYHPMMPQLSYNIFDDNNINSKNENRFENYYYERDCISFLRTLTHKLTFTTKISSKFFGKQIIKSIDDDITIYDFFGHNVELESVEIQKVFKSNARPILIRGIAANEDDAALENVNCHYIVKLGDDLRRDQAVISMFKLMNYFWKKHGLKYNKIYDVECLIYNVIPMGNDFGVIEYIGTCVPLAEVLNLEKDKSVKKKYNTKKNNPFVCKLVSSAAAAYISSFICGIRDRHYDNILIRKTDGTLFHIDFNYLWTKVGFLDAAKLAITKDLKSFMGDEHWRGFVDTATSAYLIVRKHFNEIISFCNIVFDFITYTNSSGIKPQRYLYDQLKISLDDEKAEQYIRKKLEQAPFAISTKLKNAMHKISQKS